MTTRWGYFGQAGALAATALFGIGVGVGAAVADPSPSHTDSGRHLGQSAATTPARPPAHHQNAHASAHANANANGSAHASASARGKSHAATAQPASQTGGSVQPAAVTADPPGNNGTVKIAGVGDLDGIPNNTAHPGCSFEVQWYGFDGGSDVVSTVSFTPQAPTSDVTIGVNGPTQVPVGGDAASGAGTATGLDATQTYTLSFSGGAPAKQGYHVRLTVATPRSQGNDTKTKVFWVEPCTGAASPAAVATPVPTAGSTPDSTLATTTPDTLTAPLGAPGTSDSPAALAAPQALTDAPAAVAPAEATAPLAADDATGDSATSDRAAAGVPTAIDAGQHHSLVRRMVTSPWAAGLVALGVLAALSGVLMGARRRA